MERTLTVDITLPDLSADVTPAESSPVDANLQGRKVTNQAARKVPDQAAPQRDRTLLESHRGNQQEMQ